MSPVNGGNCVVRSNALICCRDQQVHIEATGEAVKIVGLTLDHGLLRTVPVANLFAERGAAPSSRRFIDLQPDGNGFDMLKGLLVSRK